MQGGQRQLTQARSAVELEAADYGFGAGGVFTTRDGTCVTRCFGAGFFLGFLISRLRASLFPMPSSLPQVVPFEKRLRPEDRALTRL
jgi:hypothetical protein